MKNCSTIVSLLQSRALSQSQKTAFMFLADGETETEILTYRELDRRSRAIAARLQELNLRGERALLLYPSGLDYLAAFFGCLYAGVIAVPAYPPQNKRKTPRIQAIAVDSAAKIVLTTDTLLFRMESLFSETETKNNFQWLATDTIDRSIADIYQKLDIDKDSIAFLQYTSGSTGTPKGVMVSHSNLLHNAAMTYRWMGHSPESKFVSWLPIYHDMGLIGGILQPLYGGFPCYLMPPVSFLQRPYRWLQAISRYGGTTSGAPNFAYELCTQKITAEQKASLDLRSWQLAFNGAEPIRSDTLKRFSDTFTECGFRASAFYPCYGMAETTLIVSGEDRETRLEETGYQTKAVDKLALAENKIIQVSEEEDSQVFVGCGKSIPGQEIAIAHPETLTLCEPNRVGEIWVRGDSVAKGYWNHPGETKETFQALLKDDKEDYFLRTGDLGFLDDEGELFITGRLKDLIIIRGRNLYPQDIELTSETSHDALRMGSNAAFTIEKDNEEKLVIVQELEFRAKPNLEKVITAIRQAVTEVHEIEVYGVVLIKPGRIPKTSSGKIQRRATRQKFLEGTLDIVASHILKNVGLAREVTKLERSQLLELPPREGQTLLESYLTQQEAQVLGIAPEDIDLEEPLTTLGLDSIKVFELKNQIEVDLELEVSVADFFEGMSTRWLSTKILAQLNAHIETSKAIISTSKDNNFHPLSFAQERLWFLDRIQPDNCAYNIPIAIQITGDLNISALEQSFNEIVRRHEALRTTFIMGNKQPIQVIAPQQTIKISILDLRDLEIAKREAEVQKLALEESKRSFDLATGSLIRVSLLRLGNRENVLLLTIHHIIADRWSIGVLIEELATLYDNFINDKHAQLPELPIQYADFSVWQRQSLQAEKLETQLAYWKQQLNGVSNNFSLHTDKPRPSIQTFRGASTSFTLSRDLSEAVKTLSRQEGVTLFMTLLATLQILLCKYTKQKDIVVGTDVANRYHSQLEPLIGFFVNILVLRTNFSGNPTFREILQQVREVTLGAYAHQDFPFAKLVEALCPERNLSHTPLFQVLFVLNNTPMPPLEFSGLRLTPLGFDTGTTKFDLVLFIDETEEGLKGTWQYNTDLFEPSTITPMSEHFETLLNNIVNQPDSSIESLEIMTKRERQNLNLAHTQNKRARFMKLTNIKPKAVNLSAELVKTYLLDSGKTLPLVIESAHEDTKLAGWAKSNREFIESKLLQHGGILFRNFKINSATKFENFARSICSELFGDYGDLPREGAKGNVYGSTIYPADKSILFHNESSHLQTWPIKIWFFCVQPAREGGETPIVDCRRIYQLLNPEIRKRLEQKQLMYVRNFIKGIDVSWQKFFGTNERTVVENYCHQNGMDFEWLPDNNLRTRSYQQAITRHPRTGEMVFFNQIQLHHISFLEPSVQKSLLSLFDEENLPRNVYYRDGSSIEQSVIEEITKLYQQLQVSFFWHQGDILMLDNMLTAHSRNPYVGYRKILVAMGEINNKVSTKRDLQMTK